MLPIFAASASFYGLRSRSYLKSTDKCRLILADRNEKVLKLEVSIGLIPVGDPIDPGTTILQPVDDACLQNGARFNHSTLMVEAGRRITCLKFAVSGLSGSMQTATLRLQENGGKLVIQTSGTSTTTQSLSANPGNDHDSTRGLENVRGLLHTQWDPTEGQWLIGWSGVDWVLQEPGISMRLGPT